MFLENNPNALLKYIEEERGRLDIKKFKAILNQGNINVNARNANGHSIAYLLMRCGGMFKSLQLLLQKGAFIDQETLDLAFSQNNQTQILFLICCYCQKNNIEPNNQAFRDFKELADFSFPEKNQFGKIIKKIIDNVCNFSALKEAEIALLDGYKFNIAEQKLKLENSSSENSGSEDESKPKIKTPSPNFGTDDEKIINLCKEFITNFASVMTNRQTELQESRRFILNEENQQRVVVALRKILRKEAISINDMINIAQNGENAAREFPEISAIFEEHLPEIASEILKTTFDKNPENNLPKLPIEIFHKITSFLDTDSINSVVGLAIPSPRPSQTKAGKFEEKETEKNYPGCLPGS